jgi:hypothetical protein
MNDLLLYKQSIASLYSDIESKLPRNRKHTRYNDSVDFKQYTLKGPKTGNDYALNRLRKDIKDLEDEINESEVSETEISEDENQVVAESK